MWRLAPLEVGCQLTGLAADTGLAPDMDHD